jgi:acyl dehydratase
LPNRDPDHVIDLPTRPEQALYYRLNGDMNPLHADPAFAAKAGFDRPILHGLCTFGIICHAILRALADYEPARLRSLSGRFSGVVFSGETLRVELWNSGEFRARVVERDALVIDDGKATLADAE